MTYEATLFLNWQNAGYLPENIYDMPARDVLTLLAIEADIEAADAAGELTSEREALAAKGNE